MAHTDILGRNNTINLTAENGFSADRSGGLSGTTSTHYATNIAEKTTSQPLPNNTKVRMYISYDDQCPSSAVYRFDKGADAPIFYAKVNSLWTAGDQTINCTPCHQDGSSITGATATNIFIELPYNSVQFCGYQINDITAYILLSNGDPFLLRNILPKSTRQFEAFYNTSASGPSNIVPDFYVLSNQKGQV